jgi:cellulose synthase/poly-beta-1,6-N-acetylglucosamine synthase-like glycosyltransferase
MMILLILLTIAGIYMSAYVVYWLVLLATHFLLPARPAPTGTASTRFAIVVPAHNEELLLPLLLESTGKQKYPGECYDTIVIADNCTDGTARAARENGAITLERADEQDRGKGFAIMWALQKIDLDRYDAVLIVDADCVLGESALRHLDGTLHNKQAIQCYSGVVNPDDSWFTRLLDVSRTINNHIYSPAKQRLGLSSELTGTGMCFATRILKEHGWDAFTVGEDWEYYAKLIEKGESVGFDHHARVLHRESSSLKQATSQRMRWSSGRFAVAWRFGFRLLWKGLIDRDPVKIDAGLCLIFPNPSLGMNVTLLCLAGALLLEWGAIGPFVLWFLLLALVQLGVFVVGVFYTRKKLRNFLAIFVAPAFLAWKMGIDALSILGFGRKKWVRTERKL